MFPRIALILPLAQSVATLNKHRSQTRISGQLNVSISIANHPARTSLDLKLLRRTINQSRLRLATITIDAVRRFSNRRMMSAVVNRIEMSIFQIVLQLLVDLDDDLLRKISARDAGLVGDQNRQPIVV